MKLPESVSNFVLQMVVPGVRNTHRREWGLEYSVESYCVCFACVGRSWLITVFFVTEGVGVDWVGI